MRQRHTFNLVVAHGRGQTRQATPASSADLSAIAASSHRSAIFSGADSRSTPKLLDALALVDPRAVGDAAVERPGEQGEVSDRVNHYVARLGFNFVGVVRTWK